VDFKQASSVGKDGERLVSEALQRLSLLFGFRHLDNVVLKVAKYTAQIDHLVVDSTGIVIIESKVRDAAYIKGNDVEKSWTACYPGGRNKRFENPIRQNQWHDTVLRQVLRDEGMTLEPDYIDTVAVFVGADLSGLDLRDAVRQRVLDISQLESYFTRRAMKAAERPPLMAPFVSQVLLKLAANDVAHDKAVLAEHAAHRSKKSFDEPLQITAGGHSGGVSRSDVWRPSAAQETARKPSRDRGSRRSWAASRTDRPTSGLLRIAQALLVFGLFYWFALGGGLDLVARSLVDPFLKSLAGPSKAATETPRGPTVQMAKQRLNEVAPEIYAAASDLDSPKVETRADGTAFTWRFLAKTKPDTVIVQTFTLVLAADGSMRSMGASK
jgi:hypothetical protein